jgi:hypothetical protein
MMLLRILILVLDVEMILKCGNGLDTAEFVNYRRNEGIIEPSSVYLSPELAMKAVVALNE